VCRCLSRPHYLQLLNTLEAVHAGGMFNCDIKPSNVFMHGDNVVLCDWGSAAFAVGDDPLLSHRVGSIGFCDLTLTSPDAPHDSMALVRTVIPCTGKLIIGKLSDPINLSGSGFRFNSDKFIGNYRS
jgi:serine/threonine protein kinase